MLGGPILGLVGLTLWLDNSPELAVTKESQIASAAAVSKLYKVMMVPGFIGWFLLVGVAYTSYGTSLSSLWNDIWVNASPSVGFMTIDTATLYLGVLMFIAYRHGEIKAVKTLILTAVLGPATAALFVIDEAENEMDFAQLNDDKKKD